MPALRCVVVVVVALLSSSSSRAEVDVERDGDPIFFPTDVPQPPPAYAPYTYPFELSRPQATTAIVGLVTGVPAVLTAIALPLSVVAPLALALPLASGFVAVGLVVAVPIVAVGVAHEPELWQSATLLGTTIGAAVVGFVGGAAAGGALYFPLRAPIGRHVFRSEDGDQGVGFILMAGTGALIGISLATTTSVAITTSLLEEPARPLQ